MFIPPLFEFGKLTVADPGVPGQERIIFRPTESTNLAQFGMLVGWKKDDGLAVPLHDFFYWFGEILVAPPSWIILYTGKGKFVLTDHNGHPAYFFYWGRESTLFTVRETVPLLARLSGLGVGDHLTMLPTYEQKIKQLLAPGS